MKKKETAAAFLLFFFVFAVECLLHVFVSLTATSCNAFSLFQSSAAGGGGGHPVILRANSPATPGTIQDTLPPALPVQRIPNPHVRNQNSSMTNVRNSSLIFFFFLYFFQELRAFICRVSSKIYFNLM